MARITVEDCLTKETNRFALIHLASKRTKQLLQGATVVLSEACDNKPVVTSLREIAEGKVRFMTAEEAERLRELDLEEKVPGLEAPSAQAAVVPTPEAVPETNGHSRNGDKEDLLGAADALFEDSDDDDDDEDDEEGEGEETAEAASAENSPQSDDATAVDATGADEATGAAAEGSESGSSDAAEGAASEGEASGAGNPESSAPDSATGEKDGEF